jgi:3-isopropylmalate/(R)-2-methylmalate dehydratase large subunit
MDRQRPRSVVEKIWDAHRIADLGDGIELLHIDRHVVQETTSARAFEALRRLGRRVARPELTFATQDHLLSTAPGRDDATFAPGMECIRLLRANCAEHGVAVYDVGDARQGIAHVVAPELGIALPGCTLVCGDSHTATNGGLGALAWGIGTTEVAHVLAAQALQQRRPRMMRVAFSGRRGACVTPKDMVLFLIGRIGAAAGAGHFVEYAGSAVRGLPIEGRLTLCNMSIEFGARAGIVAPDDTTYEYLAGRPLAPAGAAWEAALDHWRELASDEGAAFDSEVEIDCAEIPPQVTWGNSPQQVIGVDDMVPDPERIADPARREEARRSLGYMDLRPGMPIAGLKIDLVFIGSCTNGRLSDLESAAGLVAGRRVAPGLRALVVPGSTQVKRAAEAKGLDRVFREAGFEWREAGCSMCVSINDDFVPPGARCVSTSNRNFENRQGPGSRTHLCSPLMAAAAALTGAITDVRRMAA